MKIRPCTLIINYIAEYCLQTMQLVKPMTTR